MSDSTENKSKPSREQLEARVVAMLLGEASPFEEEQLREQLKGDDALAKFCAEIKQTLPLLNEALDVGQAPKAKSPKMRLARKRRGKLKQLFRNGSGLAKRKIFRVEFRKALAIAAAVCVVLLVVASLLLPILAKAKPKAQRIDAEHAKRTADLMELLEVEEELRAGIVGNNTRVDGGQAAAAPTSLATVTVVESEPGFSRDDFAVATGFSTVETGLSKPHSTLLVESFGASIQVRGEADQSAVVAAAVSTRGFAMTATSVLKDGDKFVFNRSDRESSNSGGRNDQLGRRKFAELSMPESDDMAETPGRAAYQELAASTAANLQGQARGLGESKEMEGFSVNESLATVQKSSAPQPTSPAEQPVLMFESALGMSASGSTLKPADGVELHWYREKSAAESGGVPTLTPEPMLYGMAETNFVTPPPSGAVESDYKSHAIDTLYSIIQPSEPTTKEFFKRSVLNGPTAVPVPQATVSFADDNGRAYGWRYDDADKIADQSGTNPNADVRYKKNREISQAGKAANEQWGEQAETRNQDNPAGGMGGMMGGGGIAGGGGGFGGGFASGDSAQMAMPESFNRFSNSRFGLAAPPQSVSGGAAASFSLDLDADGQLESVDKRTTFGRSQLLEQGKLDRGTVNFSRFDGRGDLQLSEDESGILRQTADVTSGEKGFYGYDSGGEDVVEHSIDRLGELSSRDQSGEVDFYFAAQASSAKGGEPGYAGQEEQAKEGRKSKGIMLGDVPMLGGMFKYDVKSETAGRELERKPQLRSADEKTRTRRSGSSRSSGRGRSLGLDREVKDIIKLSAVESESLVEVVDEDQLISGPGQRQLLARKSLGANGKRIDSKKPKNLSEKIELSRGKGKQMAANKKLPAPKAKPQSAERLSRLSLAKREGKKLTEALKETAPAAKPPAPSVVYTPRPETVTVDNNFSTFSLNVSDVAFKTTLASLQAGKLPEPTDVRSEEFLNALEYRDPMPRVGEPLAFHWERARSPFTHDRDIIRFSVRTAALGRQPGRAINLVCLLDNSGSMEREDRVSIVRQALGVLARKLTPNDRVSLITFARTPK
ncbi:MAG: hypothetical protein ACI8QI_001582, partial [Limisphaerales bacterium]